MFDFPAIDGYSNTAKNLHELLITNSIQDIFTETFSSLTELPYGKCKKSDKTFDLGIKENRKLYTKEDMSNHPQSNAVKVGDIKTFSHMHVTLSSLFVDTTGKSIPELKSIPRAEAQVFERGLTELKIGTLETLLELNEQGSLRDMNTHIHKVEAFATILSEYKNLKLSAKATRNWIWVKSLEFKFPKFRTELVGVFCFEMQDLGVEKACLNWNKRVDPLNYKKVKAPYTASQKKKAQELVETKGYTASFGRRMALLSDIKVTEIKHVNSGSGALKKVSMFDVLPDTATAPSTQSKFRGVDNAEEISIEDFLSTVLPGSTSVEAYLETTHQGNLVTLTTSTNEDSKNMFQWNNNYSWTYFGGLAGKSELTQRVESSGGRIDGVFRFSHSWNELDRNQSLMDLHVFLPGNNPTVSTGDHYGNSNRVGWNMRTNRKTKGSQDVDYVSAAPKGKVPVENITFPELALLPEGDYKCRVHNWSFRTTSGRGTAEISLLGDTYEYVYPALGNKEWCSVATVTLKDGKFTIQHHLPLTGGTSKELYGLSTGKFHKVNLVCSSPNHWGDNNVGNLHHLFMLEGCKSEDSIRTYHIENLNSELTAERKVLEPLGNVMKAESIEGQLSGIGFNSTVSDTVILKVQDKNSQNKMLKVKFNNK